MYVAMKYWLWLDRKSNVLVLSIKVTVNMSNGGAVVGTGHLCILLD